MKYIKYLFIPLLFLNSIMASSQEKELILLDNSDHKTIEYSSEEDDVVDLVTSPTRTSLRERRKNNCCPSNDECKKIACKACWITTITAGTGLSTWYTPHNKKHRSVCATFLASSLSFVFSSLCIICLDGS